MGGRRMTKVWEEGKKGGGEGRQCGRGTKCMQGSGEEEGGREKTQSVILVTSSQCQTP